MRRFLPDSPPLLGLYADGGNVMGVATTGSNCPIRILWVVERSNAWHSRCRRNSKDYERRPDSSESMIKISHIGVMLRRCSPTKSPNFNYRDADV